MSIRGLIRIRMLTLFYSWYVLFCLVGIDVNCCGIGVKRELGFGEFFIVGVLFFVGGRIVVVYLSFRSFCRGYFSFRNGKSFGSGVG